jgi:hypothetical protein
MLGTTLSPISAMFRINVDKQFTHNQTSIFEAAVEFVDPLFLAGKLVALIVGLGVGLLLVIGGIILGIFMYKRHRKEKKDRWNRFIRNSEISENKGF